MGMIAQIGELTKTCWIVYVTGKFYYMDEFYDKLYLKILF